MPQDPKEVGQFANRLGATLLGNRRAEIQAEQEQAKQDEVSNIFSSYGDDIKQATSPEDVVGVADQYRGRVRASRRLSIPEKVSLVNSMDEEARMRLNARIAASRKREAELLRSEDIPGQRGEKRRINYYGIKDDTGEHVTKTEERTLATARPEQSSSDLAFARQQQKEEQDAYNQTQKLKAAYRQNNELFELLKGGANPSVVKARDPSLAGESREGLMNEIINRQKSIGMDMNYNQSKLPNFKQSEEYFTANEGKMRMVARHSAIDAERKDALEAIKKAQSVIDLYAGQKDLKPDEQAEYLQAQKDIKEAAKTHDNAVAKLKDAEQQKQPQQQQQPQSGGGFQEFNVGGKVYRIPNDKVAAFKKAKGIQ